MASAGVTGWRGFSQEVRWDPGNGNGLARIYGSEANPAIRYSCLFEGFITQQKISRGRPGYEHLNEQLHILIEADLPPSVVDLRLRQAQEITEEFLKPV
ncbi:KH domain-containing protein, partial [Tanacetum coccineum]